MRGLLARGAAALAAVALLAACTGDEEPKADPDATDPQPDSRSRPRRPDPTRAPATC